MQYENKTIRSYGRRQFIKGYVIGTLLMAICAVTIVILVG